MKKKQIIGIVIAGFVFIVVCMMSMLMRFITNQMNQAVNTMITDGVTYTLPSTPYVGVVNIDGTIQNVESSWLETSSYHHEKTLKYIEAMIKSNSNKGILLCVDSPGGYVYEVDELYLKLKEYKEITKRPIWAYMKNTACSGGYYITMAADNIYGNRNGITGSIGVIMSLNNLKGLYDKLGIEEIDITSGENKAMGSAGIEMTQEQKEIYQSVVDEAYEQFVDIIVEGRKIEKETVKKLADGRIYTMKQAKEANLIDGVQTYEQTKEDFLNEIGGRVSIYEPNFNQTTWLSSFLGAVSEAVPKSDTQVLTRLLEEQRNGVLMYYAD